MPFIDCNCVPIFPFLDKVRRHPGRASEFKAVSATGHLHSETCSCFKQSQTLHNNLYSAADFKKSKLISGLTVLKRPIKERTWSFCGLTLLKLAYPAIDSKDMSDYLRECRALCGQHCLITLGNAVPCVASIV